MIYVCKDKAFAEIRKMFYGKNAEIRKMFYGKMPKSVKCFMVKMPKSVKCLPILEEKRKLKSRNILMNLCHNESPKSCCTWEILALF